MATIFRKTAKGVHEIETRAYRLPPRVRNALILVDGRRDVSALQALMPQQLDGTLQLLVEQAFIEVAGESAVSLPSRAADDVPGHVLAAPPGASAPPVAGASAPPFNLRQRAAVRELNDTIGPIAEPLAIRMERARDDADLRPLVHAAVQLIGNARGRSVADAYARRHGL